jgi:hypothetical protein
VQQGIKKEKCFNPKSELEFRLQSNYISYLFQILCKPIKIGFSMLFIAILHNFISSESLKHILGLTLYYVLLKAKI